MQNAYPIGHRDVILQKTPYVFDVSVWELSWWSIEGAAVYLLGPGEEKNPGAIIEAIEKNKITTMHFVPSMLNAFLDYLEDETIDAKRLTGLRKVFASGEALEVSQVERFNKLIYNRTRTRLINLYGPTEATVDVSYFNCSPSPQVDKIPIGKPIDNIQLYIVNPHLQLQPIGIPGELCIAGAGLARGYLNNPELTAERFCLRRPGGTLFEKTAPPGPRETSAKNFLLECPDKGFYRSYMSYISNKSYIYRTGDLASWQPDGNIRFLGRIDHQVKVRGFRIEPGEIESCLLDHSAINEAVVTALAENPTADQSLCAYIVSPQELTAVELREYLSRKLPDYMVPAYFVRVEAIPLTPNGKVDRSALPAPHGSIRTGTQYAPPADELEEKLLSSWQETLGNRTIGINDDFFVLGGDSLKAITLFSKINKAFPHYKLILMDLFRHPTIKQLASHIKSGKKIEYGILQQMTAPAEGKKISLICIPYAGGSAAAYLKLAREISGTNPEIAIYTAAVPGNDIGASQPKDKSLKETAAKCLQEIKKSITTPVALYGHCVGAALTLEIARLLEKENSRLQCVFIGGALFFPDLLIKDSDMWKSKSNEEIRELMVDWGAFKKGEIPRKDLMFFIRNFRKDVKLAVDYYKNAFKESKRKKIKAPIYNIISKQDSLTRGFRWGYRKWKKFAKSSQLIVIKNGSHYFVNDKASLVSAVVLNILTGKPSFPHVQGAKRIKY
jgi:surfactin synthase thioesterase subunit